MAQLGQAVEQMPAFCTLAAAVVHALAQVKPQPSLGQAVHAHCKQQVLPLRPWILQSSGVQWAHTLPSSLPA